MLDLMIPTFATVFVAKGSFGRLLWNHQPAFMNRQGIAESGLFVGLDGFFEWAGSVLINNALASFASKNCSTDTVCYPDCE